MSNDNPYQTPAADLATENRSGDVGNFSFTGVKQLPIGRGWGWITEGFKIFKANPGIWVLLSLVYFIIVIVLSIIPLIGPLALNILNPVFIAGMMLACVAIYNRESIGVGHLFKGFQIPQTGRLCLVGLIYLALLFGVMIIIGVIAAVVLGASGGMETILAGQIPGLGFWLLFLIMMLVFVPIMMMMYFAPPLVALSDVSITEALSLSFKGCLKNMLPFLTFGIIGFVLLILGMIPLFLGLLIVMPVMFAAMFVAYKEIFTSA